MNTFNFKLISIDEDFEKYIILLIVTLLSVQEINAAYILVPMDEMQTNHLKAYGVAYWILEREVEISWLLNYKGGSYLIPYHDMFERECKLRNVSYQVIADVQAESILPKSPTRARTWTR